MSTTSTSPATFIGASAFASSLANVINRAVTIASFPMQILQAEQNTLQGEQGELQGLMGVFSSLGNAVTAMDSATGSSSYGATVSNSAVASATVGDGILPGTLSLTVTDTGAQTNVMSGTAEGEITVTDPTVGNISASTTFTLSINGVTTPITDSDGTLAGLANAINSSGTNVQATIVNVGSASSPDYRLSVQSLNYAPDDVQLLDPSNSDANLLSTPLTGGAYVKYQVNGQPATPINSTTRTLTVAPGLTVNVLGTGTTSVTVSQNGNSIENALASFVSAYNAAVDQANNNRGQNSGALNGDSVIYSLTSSLNNLANYASGSGNITTLSDIGITFDQNGHLQFNSSTFEQAVSTNMNDVLTFLGSVSGDNGFLGAANDIMTGINDANTGILAQDNQTRTDELSSLAQQISDDQTQINLLQQTLQNQMAAADAAISVLEQQASYLQMMFQTQNANAQLGY